AQDQIAERLDQLRVGAVRLLVRANVAVAGAGDRAEQLDRFVRGEAEREGAGETRVHVTQVIRAFDQEVAGAEELPMEAQTEVACWPHLAGTRVHEARSR